MGKRWVPCALSILLALFIARDVLADTGGSMGGGDWSSRSGGGGSTSSRDTSSSTSSSSTSSSSTSSSSSRWSSDSSDSSNSSWRAKRSRSSNTAPPSGDGRSPFEGFSGLLGFLALVVGGVIVVMISEAVTKAWSSRSRSLQGAPEEDLVDVTVLRVAIDGRARKFVQAGLARFAEISDTRTAAGRVQLMRNVSLLLRRVRDAWVYGGAVNELMRDLGSARPEFQKHVDDARSRFLEERIRAVNGDITRRDSSEYRPRSDEGEGLILVSMIIAARCELFSVSRIGDGEDLRKALEAVSALPTESLVAIEIVWQPYEESDRLSSMELEAKYPHPQIIPITGALVGKVFCAYCSGPFPAELVSCPHCGAPSPGREAPQAA